ncbi:MAG: ComEC/Rec2 family competence protein [Tannerella sp.]|jgi:competence protein ComEC|nr:ComEC/Rec2 family competence protein [Tannerella sp.]
MMEELLKRPFTRLLFWWITGIVLQVCFPLERLSVGVLFPVGVALVLPLFFRRQAALSYDARWVWGALIACLLVFLSIQMTVLTEKRLSTPSEPGWLQLKAQAVQFSMVEKLDPLSLSDDEKAILATITVNYRLAMTRELRSQFSTIGMSHLLSISGFHVAIVGRFLMFIFSFFPRRKVFRWLKYVLLMAAIWAYAYISGLSAPAVRASLMFTVYQTGILLQRSPDKYNTLAGTAFCMLWYNPFYLFDIGFQLSYLGTWSIMYLQPRFARLIEVRNPLLAYPWDILTVSLAAQIGTIPLCAYYFGKTSTVCLLTNVYLTFLSIGLIPLTLLWMLLPAGLPGSGVVQWVIEMLTRSLMWIVDRFSAIPGATVSMDYDFVTLLCSYGILVFGLCYFRMKSFPMLLSTLGLLLFILGWQLI